MGLAIVVAALAASGLGPGATFGATKELRRVVAVGADGRSVALRPAPAALDSVFVPSPYARPRGGYVKLYLLGPDGLPGIPGRYYPGSSAVCLGWHQPRAAPAGPCSSVAADLGATLAATRGLSRFRGAPTTFRLLRSPDLPSVLVRGNLRVAFELAFDRHRLARPAARPGRCIAFAAAWRGPAARTRPGLFCLGPPGVYAGGRVYPLGPGVWSLAWLNRR